MDASAHVPPVTPVHAHAATAVADGAATATFTAGVPASVRSGGPTRDGGFRWRSREPSRLEGFSDAVFGFAVTLLVISLEVPRTFADLTGLLRDVPAFALSFVLLVMIWHAQYVYFRRYALDDRPTLVLNIALLFVVLVYVYPLRFMTSALVQMFTGIGSGGAPPITGRNWPSLMIIYGVGFAAVFTLFALMYAHALRNRAALDLDGLEVHRTRFSVKENAILAGFGILSLVLAAAGQPQIAGWLYVLIGPMMGLTAWRHWRGVDVEVLRAQR